MPLNEKQTTEQSSLDREQVEVLAEEFLERFRQGERPSVSEYTARHPAEPLRLRTRDHCQTSKNEMQNL